MSAVFATGVDLTSKMFVVVVFLINWHKSVTRSDMKPQIPLSLFWSSEQG